MERKKSRSYVEHVALRIRDMDWYLSFFREVLGMNVWLVDGDGESPDQVWVGGFQLIRSGEDVTAEPQGHVGVFTEDLAGTLEKAYAYPEVTAMPQGRNWLRLPGGVVLEMMQAPEGCVDRILAAAPRK